MTDAALGGAAGPPDFRPSWLRPAALALALALHVAALATLPYLRQRTAEPPREVIVNIELEAAPAAPPAASPPTPVIEPGKPAEAAPPEEAAPPPPAQPAPALPAPPQVTTEPPPPATLAPPAPEAPPAPRPEPLEAAPPKPPPARAEPKLEAKPAPKPQPKPEHARPKVREDEPKPPATREERRAAIPASPSTETRSGAPASAASQSAYRSEIATAIQSRLFYPPQARARGAKGVVRVAFTIGSSGALTSFAITRSSGDEDLDRAARTLVESARFPPPPGGPVHVATSFNYVPP